jgi:hypothetical protein
MSLSHQIKLAYPDKKASFSLETGDYVIVQESNGLQRVVASTFAMDKALIDAQKAAGDALESQELADADAARAALLAKLTAAKSQTDLPFEAPPPPPPDPLPPADPPPGE